MKQSWISLKITLLDTKINQRWLDMHHNCITNLKISSASPHIVNECRCSLVTWLTSNFLCKTTDFSIPKASVYRTPSSPKWPLYWGTGVCALSLFGGPTINHQLSIFHVGWRRAVERVGPDSWPTAAAGPQARTSLREGRMLPQRRLTSRRPSKRSVSTSLVIMHSKTIELT